MKICHYNDHQAGAVVGDRVHPLGDTLVKAGHLRPGHTMLEATVSLAVILKRLRPRLADGEKLDALASLTMRPRNGLKIAFTKRVSAEV